MALPKVSLGPLPHGGPRPSLNVRGGSSPRYFITLLAQNTPIWRLQKLRQLTDLSQPNVSTL